MISFPLYDTLVSTIQISPDKDEPIDKNKLVKWIQSFDQDGFNKTYALIRYHGLNDNNQEPDNIPFGGYFSENGELLFDLDRIPNTLQQVLYQFSKLHIQHMKYMQKIEKIRKKSNDNK
jgi:hypothetical protein